MFNPDILETNHDLDALVRAVKIHPTESLREKLIAAEIDAHGSHIGFDQANRFWRSVLFDAA